MLKMKILVVCYSRTGKTRKIANKIAQSLNADFDEIIDQKPRRGFLGFLKAGYDATLGKTTEITFTRNPENYDLIILGTPVWNGRITPAVRTYLIKNKGKIKQCAIFATCVGRQGICLKQMRELCNSRVILEQVFFNKKENEDLIQFIDDLKGIVEYL
ncbi:MAG: hypothetical protein PWP03_160 [Candidatus Woesearchaeota archaeon]|nr:hypothetical protein [Candidatus Woesearchaeota archaeon]